MTRRLLLITVAVLALIASGCAGGNGSETPSLEDFEKAVVTARDRVDFALGRITQADSEEDLLDRMEQAATTIEDAADDLEAVEPPEDFAPETTNLVDALHQLSTDLAAVAHDVGAGIVAAPQALNFESWDKANLALAGLLGKGIEVELIQRH